jgi:hypothetical protein
VRLIQLPSTGHRCPSPTTPSPSRCRRAAGHRLQVPHRLRLRAIRRGLRHKLNRHASAVCASSSYRPQVSAVHHQQLRRLQGVGGRRVIGFKYLIGSASAQGSLLSIAIKPVARQGVDGRRISVLKYPIRSASALFAGSSSSTSTQEPCAPRPDTVQGSLLSSRRIIECGASEHVRLGQYEHVHVPSSIQCFEEERPITNTKRNTPKYVLSSGLKRRCVHPRAPLSLSGAGGLPAAEFTSRGARCGRRRGMVA